MFAKLMPRGTDRTRTGWITGILAIALLAVLAGSAASVGFLHAVSAGTKTAGPQLGPTPANQIGGGCNCYGNITTAVSGVPQYYDPGSAGCDAFMGVDPSQPGACQVYVMVNVVQAYVHCNGSEWDTYAVAAGVPAGGSSIYYDNYFPAVDTCGAPFTVSFNDYDCNVPNFQAACPGASPTGYDGEPATFLGEADYGPTSPLYSVYDLPNPFVVTSDFVQVPLADCQGATEGLADPVHGIVLEFNDCAGYYTDQPDQPDDSNDTNNDTDNGTDDDWNESGWVPCTDDNEDCEDTDAGSLDVSTGPAFSGGTACTLCAPSWSTQIPLTYADESDTNVYLQPGTYHWSNTLSDQAAEPSAGALTVTAGVPGSVNATLLQESAVTFDETGLPTGKSWSVGLGGDSQSTTGTSLNFTEGNGTYPYLVYGENGFLASVSVGTTLKGPASGDLTVAGATNVYVSFSKGSGDSVVFPEKGLPKGHTWCVELGTSDAAAASSCTATASLTFAGLPPESSYVYSANAGVGYPTVVDQAISSVGKRMHVPAIAFTAPGYTVTVHESGLPTGTTWSFKATKVDCRGPGGCGQFDNAAPQVHLAASGAGSSLTVTAANASYNWTVKKVAGYELELGNGTGWEHQWEVWGSDLSINVTFIPYTYNVTFTEAGLPSGTNWSISVGGGSHASETSSIVVALPNGTYSYTVGALSGFTSVGKPTSAKVHGKPVVIAVTFKSTGGGGAALPTELGTIVRLL